MAARKKYPDELRERAVRMLFEVREREGKGHGEAARVARQLGVHRRHCGPGQSRRKSTAERGPVPRRMISSGSRRSSGKYASCAGLMRSESRFGVFRAGTRPEASALVEFVDAHRDRFGVEPVCAVLEFPVSSYYHAKKREAEAAAREMRDAGLKEEIMEVREGGKGRKVYGARKIWLELNSRGIAVARCTVERLMRELGIRGASPGRKRPPTTLPVIPRTGRLTCWSGASTRRRRTAAGSRTSRTCRRFPAGSIPLS